MQQRCFWLRGRGEPILTKDRRDESTCRTLSLGPSNVDGVQTVEIGWLSFVSAWPRLSKCLFVAIVEAHTSYPILWHHSTISGIEFLFMLLPDFLMASTTAKLVCKVFREATASCVIVQWKYSGAVARLQRKYGLPWLRGRSRGTWFGELVEVWRATEWAVRGMILCAFVCLKDT